jgi:ribosome-associated toxin RatA of RatAB toxin-antitoxin module
MAQASRTEVIEVPFRALYDVIIDYERYPEFIASMKAAKVLGTTSDARKRVQFELDLVKRMTYVIVIKEEITEQLGLASVHWTLESGDMIKKNTGGWSLKSLGPSKTEVRYELEVELSIPVPGFVMKGLIANSLPESINQVAKRAAKQAASGLSV